MFQCPSKTKTEKKHVLIKYKQFVQRELRQRDIVDVEVLVLAGTFSLLANIILLFNVGIKLAIKSLNKTSLISS